MKKRIVCFLLAMIMVLGMIPNAAVTANAASEWTTSTNAIKVLKEYEAFEEEPYQKDADSDVWYIGYGSIIDPADYPNGISEDDALKLVQKEFVDIDKAINNFTQTQNMSLTQYEHDAIALFSYRLKNTSWLSDSTHTLREAIRTGITGNAFLNIIAQYHEADISDAEGLKASLNRRLSEANMYLNGGYGYYAPGNYTYVVLDVDGNEKADGDDIIRAYNTKTSPTLADNPDAETFLGWYVFDGEVDGFINGAPVTALDSTTAGKILVAKYEDGTHTEEGNYPNANYTINVSTLLSRYVFNEPYSRELVEEYKDSMDELAKTNSKGKALLLKKGTSFAVDTEVVLDGVKWIRGVGKDTSGNRLEGWVYMGELPEADEESDTVIATATVTASTLNIREGATTDSEKIGTLDKGVTVNIYAFKVEETETGNKTWGKINVNGIVGWINVAYTDLNEVTDTNDAADGRTGKIINTDSVNVRKEAGVSADLITTLDRGTEVTVLKTTMVGTAQWGYVEWAKLKDGYTRGWVYMYYVECEGLEHSNSTGGTGETVKYTGVVTSNINLNVRSYADIYAPKVGSLPNGTKVNVYETTTSRNMKWGRIGTDRWVCLTYVNLTEVENTTSGSTATTTSTQATVTATTLGIYKNYNSNSEQLGTLAKGDVVTILEKNTETTETGSRIWGRIIDDGVEGWINLAYVELKTVTSVSGSTSGSSSGTTTNSNGASAVIANCLSVNIREAAGVYNAQITKLNNGTAIQVYDQVTKDNAPWAKITWNNGANSGWVCMYYVEMTSGSTGSTGTTEGGLINGTNSNTISATGYVNSNIALNVRSGAGLSYGKIGSLNKGTKVTVYEQVTADGMIWGRIVYGSTSGWICMSYISVESTSSTGNGVMGTIARCFSAVNVRSAPGTGSALVGKISVGTRVEVFETRTYSNQLWGRVAQGWICMDYVLLDSELPEGEILDATVATTEATTATEVEETINRDNEVSYTITGTVSTTDTAINVRNDANVNSDRVGTVNNGQTVNILALKQNGAELWGRIDQYATAGWIRMDLVTYSVVGYVNTDDQPVYADADTSSTVKTTLSINTKLNITKLTVGGETVYGWVDSASAWIPMGRISDTQVDVIPTYKKYTHNFDTISRTDLFVGTTNAAVEAVSAIGGSTVVFKLQAGVSVPVGSVKAEGGKVWAELVAHEVIGWINLANVNFTVSGSVTTDILNVRSTKDTSVETNILGTVSESVEICELSFDSYGNLWGKVTGYTTDSGEAVRNGGYVMVRSASGTTYVSGILSY